MELPTDLITLSQAARLVGTHYATVTRWVLSGRLPFWRLGRRRFVSRAGVLAMIVPGSARQPVVPSRRETDAFTREVLRRHGLG